ncbi:MAG: hypothetical protein BWY82_01905 [Verrucomicrobia bacterium ADurb.Bin474]|nr:MAG: hypothetical protein BWY82_01905 [Verrucomicrobia bacterium ADurb.Bin474]
MIRGHHRIGPPLKETIVPTPVRRIGTVQEFVVTPHQLLHLMLKEGFHGVRGFCCYCLVCLYLFVIQINKKTASRIVLDPDPWSL